jgi:hypothetical protein
MLPAIALSSPSRRRWLNRNCHHLEQLSLVRLEASSPTVSCTSSSRLSEAEGRIRAEHPQILSYPLDT